MTRAPSTRPAGTATGVDALRALYTDWSDIMATTPGLTTRLFRSIFDEWHQPTREPEDVTYREETVGGVPGIRTLPAGADRQTVTNDATDALITVPLLEGMIAGVLAEGAVDPRTPLADPLRAGVDVTLSVVDDMQHVFPILAGNAPEADDEIAAIAARYRG